MAADPIADSPGDREPVVAATTIESPPRADGPVGTDVAPDPISAESRHRDDKPVGADGSRDDKPEASEVASLPISAESTPPRDDKPVAAEPRDDKPVAAESRDKPVAAESRDDKPVVASPAESAPPAEPIVAAATSVAAATTTDEPVRDIATKRLPRATRSDGHDEHGGATLTSSRPPTSRPDDDAIAYARGEAPASDRPAEAPPPARSSGDSDARMYARAATEPPRAAVAAATSMPSPADAAFEAARIVAEMVDIDTVTGAAVAAAAAAGAAVEAAVARTLAAAAVAPPETTTTTETGEPVITVRLNRDRVLRALQEDIAANEAAEAAMPAQARAPTIPPSAEAPSASSEVAEELDPLAIAAQAIARLRKRATTDLAELRVHYHRHDIVVVVAALAIIVVAGAFHRTLVTAPTKPFPPENQPKRGLTFDYSATWLEPEATPLPAPRIARDPTGQSPKATTAYHVELTSTIDPTARIEVLIDKKPQWSNIVTGLELDRRSRWGELYTLDDSSVRAVSEDDEHSHDWLRTEYRYAHAPEKGDVPRIDRAIEWATIDRDQIYVITFFGTPAELERIEEVVAPTLHVQSQTGLPLVPQTSRLAQRTFPDAVGRAFDSTVMVVVADIVDGRLRARGGGSGVVVGADGSILTNYHVIHDKDGRLHDVFVIGRFSTPDHAPQLQCAGKPSRGKLQREIDLALLKCDMDLDGRTWSPALGGKLWATLPESHSADIKMGQRLWVLGYPDVGGGGLTLSQGEVEGWTGEDRAAGKDFIKTDASITRGNSGGPVVDDQGRLVGIASAFRTRVTATGSVIETAQIGLVRPLSTASDLLAIAVAGWTPREGHTDVDLAPTAVEARAEGVRLSTKILDFTNEQPVRDALVMVLRPGVTPSAVDVNRLDDQVLAWGRSNTLGEVLLKQPVPVPGTYTVMVVARGYEPLIGDGELRLDAKTPASFDPWGKITLQPR